ncbi:MAG: hypothetical protein ACI3VE_02690, partial [Oscillospiraceae bacterium]
AQHILPQSKRNGAVTQPPQKAIYFKNQARMKQKSKVRENSEYAKSPCISMVFPFGALAPDGRESGHQWHSRGQRFDPAYLHH